jgi:1,4-dihydroxy-2-naphthoate octaprenyltransferase
VYLRTTALNLSFGALAAAALITILIGQEGALSPVGLLFLGLSLVLILAYAVPPFRLVNAGFGEFLLAVHIAMIAPALGFVLQQGEYHRLVAIISFPLTLLALAYFLILDFPSFAADEKFDRRTLLRSMGWQRAVPLHHFLVLAAYLLLASALLFGLAWGLVWPAFLTLPFALMQIYWLRNISQGAKPIWTLLTVNALAVFGLTAYLLTFAFWLR